MSFDYNPYKHIEIIQEADRYYLYCHGCGGRPLSVSLRRSLSLPTLFYTMGDHVRTSHRT